MRVPKYQILNFVRSDRITYRLQNSRFRGFITCKIAKPYSNQLLEMGAKYVLTGYDQNGNKTIFTGLFPMGKGIYHGDHYTPDKAKKHRLVIVKPQQDKFTLYYFASYPKTSKSRLLTFFK